MLNAPKVISSYNPTKLYIVYTPIPYKNPRSVKFSLDVSEELLLFIGN